MLFKALSESSRLCFGKAMSVTSWILRTSPFIAHSIRFCFPVRFKIHPHQHPTKYLFTSNAVWCNHSLESTPRSALERNTSNMDDKAQVPTEYQSVVSRILLTEPQIHARVAELGAKITADYRHKVFHHTGAGVENGMDATKTAMLQSELLVLGVLTGSFIFTADLSRTINIPHQVFFIKAESYEGTSSKGTVNIMGLEKVNMHGKHVIVVEDIVDTGLTLQKIKARIMELGCASVSTATLLHKNTNRRIENTPPVEYIAFEIQDEFVVGYGLDYNQALRHLPFVGIFRQ